MPKPKRNETQREFIARAIPIIMHEGEKGGQKHAIAKAYGIWREHRGRSTRASTARRRRR